MKNQSKNYMVIWDDGSSSFFHSKKAAVEFVNNPVVQDALHNPRLFVGLWNEPSSNYDEIKF